MKNQLIKSIMEHLVMIMIGMALFCIGVILFFPLSVWLRKYCSIRECCMYPMGKWLIKTCKKTQAAQVQRQAESSSNVNVFNVNSVYLPTEETVQIPIEIAEISKKSISNLQVDLDLPPSYSDLFDRRSTLV